MQLILDTDGSLRGVQIDLVSIASFALVLINTWMTREVLREAIIAKFESLKIREWLIGLPDETKEE